VVAAVSFDKVDWESWRYRKSSRRDGAVFPHAVESDCVATGCQKGLDILKRDEAAPDFDTPPADTLWREILDEVREGRQRRAYPD